MTPMCETQSTTHSLTAWLLQLEQLYPMRTDFCEKAEGLPILIHPLGCYPEREIFRENKLGWRGDRTVALERLMC